MGEDAQQHAFLFCGCSVFEQSVKSVLFTDSGLSGEESPDELLPFGFCCGMFVVSFHSLIYNKVWLLWCSLWLQASLLPYCFEQFAACSTEHCAYRAALDAGDSLHLGQVHV